MSYKDRMNFGLSMIQIIKVKQMTIKHCASEQKVEIINGQRDFYNLHIITEQPQAIHRSYTMAFSNKPDSASASARARASSIGVKPGVSGVKPVVSGVKPDDSGVNPDDSGSGDTLDELDDTCNNMCSKCGNNTLMQLCHGAQLGSVAQVCITPSCGYIDGCPAPRYVKEFLEFHGITPCEHGASDSAFPPATLL